jgi:hypothetical protein
MLAFILSILKYMYYQGLMLLFPSPHKQKLQSLYVNLHVEHSYIHVLSGLHFYSMTYQQLAVIVRIRPTGFILVQLFSMLHIENKT